MDGLALLAASCLQSKSVALKNIIGQSSSTESPSKHITLMDLESCKSDSGLHYKSLKTSRLCQMCIVCWTGLESSSVPVFKFHNGVYTKLKEQTSVCNGMNIFPRSYICPLTEDSLVSEAKLLFTMTQRHKCLKGSSKQRHQSIATHHLETFYTQHCFSYQTILKMHSCWLWDSFLPIRLNVSEVIENSL